MRKTLLGYQKSGTKMAFGITAITRSVQTLLPIICLAVALIGVSSIATAQDQTGVSFDNPEDAIAFYLQAVTQGDTAQIIQVCAIDEMSENFSFDLYIDWIQYLTISSPAPSDYPFYAEMNKAQFTWEALRQVQYLAYRLLATENGTTEGLTVPMQMEGATQFLEELNPERLAQLQVIEIGVPYPDMMNTERIQENFGKRAQIYGADELTERVVLLSFEGDYYYMGFTLLRYGENWKISGANSPLGNTSAMGTPQEITEEEFEEIIASD